MMEKHCGTCACDSLTVEIGGVPYTLDKVWIAEGDGTYGAVMLSVPARAFSGAEDNNGASIGDPLAENPDVRSVRVAVCCTDMEEDFPNLTLREIARRAAEFAAVNLSRVRARKG